MLLTMKAPANRDKGQRTVRCNEAQADILRKVGWTEVQEESAPPWFDDAPVASSPPSEQTIEPDPVADPDEIRPKRKYTRRIVTTDENGNVFYKKKPRRQYRRRDMTAEE